MNFFVIIFTIFCFFANTQSARYFKARRAIQDHYVVVLKPQYRSTDLKKFVTDYVGHHKIRHQYDSNKLIGYAAKINATSRNLILNDPRVDFIEEDQIFTIAQYYSCPATQSVDEYFLPRISQTTSTTNVYKYPTAAGQNINAYILDTGVYAAHSEFTGRITKGPSFISGETTDDGNGHGTCCAGILGGKVYGAAKKVNMIAVKVLSNAGSGATSGIISGINWVISDTRTGKKIISMSLGGGNSAALNLAVKTAYGKNIAVFVAAGNSAADASTSSPANEPTAITIGASDSANALASFSNYGSLVDIIAPGVKIKCASPTGTNAFAYLSGTSMATPLAAGVGAVTLSASTIQTPAALTTQMKTMARKNVISGLTGTRVQTPNYLLYNGCI